MYRKPKNEKDVLYILEHLREDDLAEVQAIHGKEWKEKVLADIMKTEFDILLGCTKKGDIPAAMGGAWQIESNPKGVGVCWMLSTDEIFNHKICLLRELKKEFVKYDEKFWFLYNIIYHKNSFAKGWLKRFGFKFDNPKPEGVHVPCGFEFFYRIRETRGLC